MTLLTLIAQLIAFVLALLFFIVIAVVARAVVPANMKQEVVVARPEWEDYPPLVNLEIIYWQGVAEPWRWNSYAQDLIDCAKNNLPFRHVDFQFYNCNRKDPGYREQRVRIEKLRPKKIRRFPLVCFTYLHDQEYVSVESSYDYKYVVRRIKLEWERYYGLV